MVYYSNEYSNANSNNSNLADYFELNNLFLLYFIIMLLYRMFCNWWYNRKKGDCTM